MRSANEDIVPMMRALRVEHGPRIELGHYFMRELMALRTRGIEVYLSRDPHRQERLGSDYENARPDRFPALDASLAGFGPENWFTLEGRDSRMGLVFFAAARLLSLRSTFKEEVESFRLFYVEPGMQREASDQADVSAPNAAAVRNRAALQGSFWVNPTWRGRGLARIFPTLCRWYSYTLWDVDHTIGFLHRDDAERGLGTAYGEPEAERWIRFRGRWTDDSYFVATSRAELDRRIYADAAEAARMNLVNDMLETNLDPRSVVQGRIRRS